MNKKHKPDFAAARELALLDWLNGCVPETSQDISPEEFLDRVMYTRIVPNDGFDTIVPDWQSNDIMRALRLDGYEEFILTTFDEYFTFDTYLVYFEGAQRFSRLMGYGDSVAVHVRRGAIEVVQS